jgi:hypothetical protein
MLHVSNVLIFREILITRWHLLWSSHERKKSQVDVHLIIEWKRRERRFVVVEIINSFKWKSMIKYRDCFQFFESCAKRTLKKNFKRTSVCWFLFRVNNFSSSRFFYSRYSFSFFFHLFINLSCRINHEFQTT